VHVRDVAGGVEVLTPAKLNLFLEVLARRDDGFHEIQSLIVPINLFDRLSFREDSRGQLNLNCQWARGLEKRGRMRTSTQSPLREWETLPEGNDNIAVRAVDLLRRRAGITAGASLQLIKRIPMAAGLGGGSSDAAAALLAANRAWKLDWPADRLGQLAAEIGNDVPFFFGARPALCEGRGERIRRVTGIGRLDFVVVCPPEGLATADVYRQCRPAATPRSAEALIAALRTGDHRKLGGLMMNRLQPTAEQLSPAVRTVRDELEKCDCPAAQMSGSGTACFGICRHARHANHVASRMRFRGLGRVFAVRSL
jgi:4-diphosphocytidyl-2-C-methyl-D-erythritol kinase